jgi:hypothetical protein
MTPTETRWPRAGSSFNSRTAFEKKVTGVCERYLAAEAMKELLAELFFEV